MNATWEGDDLFGQQALHLVIEIDDVISIDRVVLLCILKDITDDIVCILLLLHQLLRVGIVIDLKTTIGGQNACHTMSNQADILDLPRLVILDDRRVAWHLGGHSTGIEWI